MTQPLFRVIVADDESLSRERLRRLLQAEKEVRLVGEASTGRDAVLLIRRHRPHIALLDIRLPDLNGFEVLRELGKQKAPAIIFVTAHPEYAVPAFEVRVVDYLLKPFTRARFSEAINRARVRCAPDQDILRPGLTRHVAAHSGRIALRSGPRRLLLSFDDISYVISANSCCRVFTSTEPLKVNESLGSLSARLPQDIFVRISRFVLVNLTHVEALKPKSHGDQHLFLRNKCCLTVARTHRSEVITRLMTGGFSSTTKITEG